MRLGFLRRIGICHFGIQYISVSTSRIAMEEFAGSFPVCIELLSAYRASTHVFSKDHTERAVLGCLADGNRTVAAQSDKFSLPDLIVLMPVRPRMGDLVEHDIANDFPGVNAGKRVVNLDRLLPRLTLLRWELSSAAAKLDGTVPLKSRAFRSEPGDESSNFVFQFLSRHI